MRKRLKAFSSWFEAQAVFYRSRSNRPKLGNNTYLETVPGTNPPAFAVVLHRTPILTFWQDGRIELSSGGWKTKTTKQRLNAFLPAGYSLYQHRWNWMLQTPEGMRRFYDGMRIGGESALAADSPEPSPVSSYTVSTVRHTRRKSSPQPVTCPRHVAALISPLVKDEKREHFYAVLLNTRNVVLAVELVSLGILNSSLVHPREVFSLAIQHHAAGLVVVHNHPSGEPDPSEDDIQITRRLAEAGELVGIALLDSVIIGAEGFYSLKEGGYL